MSLDSIDKFLKKDSLWIFLSIVLMGWYFSPLAASTFYVPTYDNLDSNVVWFKILAESGKIFADNHAIIPNMMNGLPRLSYGNEFNFLLWLYYSFSPKTAYILNELFIHVIAFFSMFFLLKRYVLNRSCEYGNIPAYVTALYFSLLPFWTGSGATIALLPLATYVLLNIKKRQSNIWDWILLILIPFYSSFILVFIFYIAMAWIYFLYYTLKNKKVNTVFFFALLMFSMLYVLKNYRLVEMLLFDHNFISHRVEFNVFFDQSLWEAYRLALVNFIEGHIPHAQTLTRYILPIIIIGMFLSFFNRRLSLKESMLIWILIVLSFIVDIWKIFLINKLTLPILIAFSFIILLYNKPYKRMALLMLLIIFLSIVAAFEKYEGLKWITQYFSLLKTFNFRAHFLLPFLYAVLLAYSIKVYFKVLHLSAIFSVLFVLLQFHDSLSASYFTLNEKPNYVSFDGYYSRDIFTKIKCDIGEENLKKRFVSYGIEPAVSLYNGLYTVDGYSTNYPLTYKHLFGDIEEPCFSFADRKKFYEDWGSKVYLICLDSRPATHKLLKYSHLKVFPFFASTKKLCNIGANYVLSGMKLQNAKENHLKLIKHYQDDNELWSIWLYEILCDQAAIEKCRLMKK